MSQPPKESVSSLLHGPTVHICEVLVDMFISNFRKLAPREQVHVLRKLVERSLDALENPNGDTP